MEMAWIGQLSDVRKLIIMFPHIEINLINQKCKHFKKADIHLVKSVSHD
jgi:hypothetical protein